MQLKKEGKNELRKFIEEQLKNVPVGQKAHIDKELLEELLFEKIVYNDETKEYFKLPVWSGDFLSKIELKEVNFENVSWSILGENTEKNINKMKKLLNKNEESNIQEEYDLSSFNGIINYSNTDAKIYFNKSIEYKLNQKIELNNCNFANTDLINNSIENYSIINCNLSNTDIKFKKLNIKEIINTNLYGVNLSRFLVDSVDIVNYFINVTKNADLMNLNNTKIRIIYNENDRKEVNFKIKSLIKYGKLNGCTINNNSIINGKIKENKESAIEKIKFKIKLMSI